MKEAESSLRLREMGNIGLESFRVCSILLDSIAIAGFPYRPGHKQRDKSR